MDGEYHRSSVYHPIGGVAGGAGGRGSSGHGAGKMSNSRWHYYLKGQQLLAHGPDNAGEIAGGCRATFLSTLIHPDAITLYVVGNVDGTGAPSTSRLSKPSLRRRANAMR
ncbi:hypothetical protein [Sodalis-like endosymbiont of Proechinophthirus fluctus]|uniref:hypothetical protein n=1 Tax=Sodalis-like endosymbiont of Proechinophthirus fluctus TaxID=1462730 RepID=UPI00164FED93|nr:hypothetical protein [Sodalis-like endosymbiont of Proechinophthirus fluctus]